MVELISRSGATEGSVVWQIDVTMNQHHAEVTLDATTITEPGLAQLSDLLNWLVSLGSTSMQVQLGGLTTVDADLLQVLREVRQRLDGALVATCRQAEVRQLLSMLGLDGSERAAAVASSPSRGTQRRQAHRATAGEARLR